MGNASNVLTFPLRNKGRVRKAQSMNACGEMVLNSMAVRGEGEPDNVVRLHPLPEPAAVERSAALLLAVSVWATVPQDRREDVRRQIRFIASAQRCPHALARIDLLGEAK